MPRNLDGTMLTAISGNSVNLAVLVDLQLLSGSLYVWSGVGAINYNSNTYLGVGNMGGVGDVQETLALQATGTTISLSGIDSKLLGDCLTDIQVGAPATIYMAAFNPATGAMVGTPYPIYRGTVDKPSIHTGADKITISLSIENKLYNQSRATARRYTSADQRRYYPTDTAFKWVERLNDEALRWGS